MKLGTTKENKSPDAQIEDEIKQIQSMVATIPSSRLSDAIKGNREFQSQFEGPLDKVVLTGLTS
ncbi:MAG: hypothetical protein AAB358_00160 [Patescibacteria group bacterium]